MSAVFLSLHVLAAIITIGPVCVAASMFPAAVRRALGDDVGSGHTRLMVLARICRVYAVVGLAVPVFGFMTASAMGILGETWLIVSILLTFAAFAILAAVVLPGQHALLDAVASAGTTAAQRDGDGAAPSIAHAAGGLPQRAIGRLAAFTGIFNILWALVTVLMIVRPGSTTGV